MNTSSNPNGIILDVFCGCGTALVAAQNLGRRWIGIDISPTACRVMAKRLRDELIMGSLLISKSELNPDAEYRGG